MSSQMKQQETLEHIYMSLQNILKVLKELRAERKQLIAEVIKNLKPIMENPALPNLIAIDTLALAIGATPTIGNHDMIDLTKQIIDQTFLIKKGYDEPEYTELIVKDWIKAFFERLDIVLTEQDSKIYDYINKLFQLLGAFRQYLEVEDEKDTKAKSEKREEQSRPKIIIGGD